MEKHRKHTRYTKLESHTKKLPNHFLIFHFKLIYAESERELYASNWDNYFTPCICIFSNYLNKLHKGTNQVSCLFFKLIIYLQVQVELFKFVTLTSPHFSLSPLRKHAQTCHLHCSAFLTHSYNICSLYNGLKESPDPKVEGQVTSYTPSGRETWTWQLITSPEVVWAGLLWAVLHCLLPV